MNKKINELKKVVNYIIFCLQAVHSLSSLTKHYNEFIDKHTIQTITTSLYY